MASSRRRQLIHHSGPHLERKLQKTQGKKKQENVVLARLFLGRCKDAPSERIATETLLRSVDLVKGTAAQAGWQYSHGVADHGGAVTRQRFDGIDGVGSTAL